MKRKYLTTVLLVHFLLSFGAGSAAAKPLCVIADTSVYKNIPNSGI